MAYQSQTKQEISCAPTMRKQRVQASLESLLSSYKMTNDSILVGNPCKPFTGFYLIVLGNPANTPAIDMISLLVKSVEANSWCCVEDLYI